MKKKIIIITISLIMILILGIYFSTISNAAIEIKSGTEPHTNIKVTNSYQYCYDMRSSTSTLGNNSLDPHLTLNADWSAVAYLGASAYGSIRDIDGESVTIGDTTHNSTTNNITGVMDMGKTADTQTASLMSGYESDANRRAKLEENANTKYVEILSADDAASYTRGQAVGETAGWYSSVKSCSDSIARPMLTRKKVFGYIYGLSGTTGSASLGEAENDATYRPVIWN